MRLQEFLRFFTQHCTLHCYMLLSIWILLLVAGMYKYMGQNTISQSYKLNFLNGRNLLNNSNLVAPLTRLMVNEENTNLPFNYIDRCAHLESIVRLNDGGILDGWNLLGVLLIIRHGDRGPMCHLRSIEHLNCGLTNNYLVKRYRSFLFNSTTISGTNHMYWSKLGAFHNFPLLPIDENKCLLGQLTYKGIAQLLYLGDLLHNIYARPLGLWNKLNIFSRNQIFVANRDRNKVISVLYPNSDEVIVFSTRARRTFQSAVAFLYTFLPTEKWLELNLKESHSMTFCFTECVCTQADILHKRFLTMQNKELTKEPFILNVTEILFNNLLQYRDNSKIIDPNKLIDALNIIICHKASWPCRNLNNSFERISTNSKSSITDTNEFINIDFDISDVNKNNKDFTVSDNLFNSIHINERNTALDCIDPLHVRTILSFMNRQWNRESNQFIYKQRALLRTYGMLRHIVSYMLRIVSGDRTKFVLYSGHDLTLQHLIAALNIRVKNYIISYATRLAFEIYRSGTRTEYYFRVIYQGLDVTRQIEFCEGGKSLRITRDSHGNKADLCPIENIIRFLHEDYFAPLNATNFKDACMKATN